MQQLRGKITAPSEIQALLEQHYEVPEAIALPTVEGNIAYVKGIDGITR